MCDAPSPAFLDSDPYRLCICLSVYQHVCVFLCFCLSFFLPSSRHTTDSLLLVIFASHHQSLEFWNVQGMRSHTLSVPGRIRTGHGNHRTFAILTTDNRMMLGNMNGIQAVVSLSGVARWVSVSVCGSVIAVYAARRMYQGGILPLFTCITASRTGLNGTI